MKRRIKGEGSYSTRPNGTVQFSIVIDGQRKYFYGKNQTQAHKKYRDYVENKSDKPSSNMLFINCVELWYKECKVTGLTKTQKMSYDNNIKKIKNSLLGKSKLCNITTSTINTFFKQPNIAKLKSHIVLKTILKNTFEYAIEIDLINKNPYTKSNKPKQIKQTPKFFYRDDVNKILDYSNVHKFGLAIKFLLYTGMREGELCALEWEDINLKNRIIDVHKTVVYDYGGFQIKPTTKTSYNREIGINDELLKALNEIPKEERKGYIFVSNTGKFYTTSVFAYHYKNFFKDLNNSLADDEKVNYLSPHKMRHTFSSYVLDSGANIIAVKETLGHCSINTTQIYTHVDIDGKHKITNMLTY